MLDPQTRAAVMSATYSTMDAAFAVGQGNFGDWQRNLRRKEFLVLPRHTEPGPGGGNFRYGHLVELAFHLHVGAVVGHKEAKAGFYGLCRKLKDNDTGLAKFNQLNSDEKSAVWHGGTFTKEEDPLNLNWFVDFPHLVFSEEFISRSNDLPTFFVFNPLNAEHHFHDSFLIDGLNSLSCVYRQFAEKVVEGTYDEESRQAFADTYRMPAIVPLTAIVTRLEALLAIRLRGRGPIGA